MGPSGISCEIHWSGTSPYVLTCEYPPPTTVSFLPKTCRWHKNQTKYQCFLSQFCMNVINIGFISDHYTFYLIKTKNQDTNDLTKHATSWRLYQHFLLFKSQLPLAHMATHHIANSFKSTSRKQNRITKLGHPKASILKTSRFSLLLLSHKLNRKAMQLFSSSCGDILIS